MTEIRTVSYLLHPPILEGCGLGLALQSYLQGFSKRTGIKIDFDSSPEFGRLASDAELVLFRVVQEALTNIWRHSGSSTASIQLQRQTSNAGSDVTLSIEDAGKGIPPEIRRSTLARSNKGQQGSSGLGLIGMRERLHQVGGRLEIESATGKTVIRAIVPFSEPSA
jgi:signal transduction histidine kinase